MNQKHGWLIALAVVVLLVAACGPQPATPTTKAQGATPTEVAAATPGASAQVTVQPTAQSSATTVPLDLSTLPIDPNDWHALGSSDAKVTIVEYSEYR
jgi:protein-disulfide isomerase